MTPSLTRYVHIHRALAAQSPAWAAAHRLRQTPAGLLFQMQCGNGPVIRTVFAVVENESVEIVSGLTSQPVAESTLLAWLNDPEGLRGFA